MAWRSPASVFCQNPIQVTGATAGAAPCLMTCLPCPVCSSPRRAGVRLPCRAAEGRIACRPVASWGWVVLSCGAVARCGGVVAEESALQGMIHLLQIGIGCLQLLQVLLQALCGRVCRCVLAEQLLPLGLEYPTFLTTHPMLFQEMLHDRM